MISLKVNEHDGNAIVVRIARTTQLKILVKFYCDYHSIDLNSVTFWFHGNRLQTNLCPDEIQMEDGDEIYAIQSRHIKLRVKGQVGFGALFEINRTTRLKKLMDVYCCLYSFDFDEVAFLFNGRLVESEQTPEMLGMKNGDEMLAMLQLRSV